MKPPARCSVVRIVEVDGPKGGRITVLLLRCGSWVTRRLRADKPPPAAIWCLSCHVRAQLQRELEAPGVRSGSNGTH